MCGIAGIFNPNSIDLEVGLNQMSECLGHRGPDDRGIWISDKKELGFCHRRLSILDLSPSGHQPMASDSGRYVMVFNGEIYNFKALQQELAYKPSDSPGDSKVLLECFSRWGVEKTLPKIKGMFAIALWDLHKRELTLIRDPIGIKPLYYGQYEKTWFFASELSAISKVIPEKRISNVALSSLLNFGNVVAPHSIYEKIKKCPPGVMIKLKENGKQIEEITYHSIYDSVRKGLANMMSISEAEAVEELESRLSQLVKEHMVADVSLGCFLSGGIDSSLISALAQAHCHQPLKTFTIGMRESGYNEALDAKAISTHLGTDHSEYYLDASEMVRAIPSILDRLDEPFADSSLIPTFFVSKMTKDQVKVSLSGDGGDELFCGYTRYKWSRQLWSVMRWLPMPLRVVFSHMIHSISRENWDVFYSIFKFVLPSKYRETHFGQKLYNLERTLRAKTAKDIYERLVSHVIDLTEHLIHHVASQAMPELSPHWNELETLEEKMMLTDLMHYLPNDILTKVDRASMMVSLEARVPFLTPDMVEFAWSIPMEYKKNKSILKKILSKYVPDELVDRPKMGFGIAIGQWLRGPLKEWAEDLLNEERLKQQNLIHTSHLRKLWAQHLNGQQNHEYLLWNHLTFQHWCQKHHA